MNTLQVHDDLDKIDVEIFKSLVKAQPSVAVPVSMEDKVWQRV